MCVVLLVKGEFILLVAEEAIKKTFYILAQHTCISTRYPSILGVLRTKILLILFIYIFIYFQVDNSSIELFKYSGKTSLIRNNILIFFLYLFFIF